MNHFIVVVVKTPEFPEIHILLESSEWAPGFGVNIKYLMSDCTQRMTILYRFYVSEMFQV